MDEPKKYIRTFAGDMETLKKGGTPDLAPLRTVPAVPSVPSAQPPVATLPAQPLPTPPPPEPQKIAEPFPSVAPKEPAAAPLKTYSGDFFDRMKATKATTATVLAAEQDSAPIISQPPPEKFSRSNILYSIAGGILLIAGIAGAYVAYTRYLAVSSPILPVLTVSAPIFVDEREQISGTGTTLFQAIGQLTTRPLAAGAVRLLSLDATATTSVFSALQVPAPSVLLRNVVTAGSMAGVVSTGGGTQSPFFILSVASFGDTFAGMLQWEPLILRDLARLFPPYPAPAIATTTSATTTLKSTGKTASTTPPAPAARFVDAIVANHDVRVYRDTLGRDILLYGYWNQTTLVIARDVAAFTEIIGRLATSRAQL
ncbi:MAG: hypothetical protein WC814_00270 [Candidatus Paceibacterota bacterium]|jgi:hypothetical protein